MVEETLLQTLYLNLLEQTLTGVILQDGGFVPELGEATRVTSVGYDSEARRKGLDWPAHAHTMVGLERLRNLRRLTATVIADGTAGDFLEAGVWRGGASIYMRALLAAHGITDRRVWVVDSFAGLPPPNAADYPADRGDRLHEFDYLAVPLDEVKRNFQKYGMLDAQVEFVPGWFKDTLPSLPVGRLAVLRLDGDLYESTTQCLESLYDRVSRRGFVIIDDFGLPPCREAVEHFRAARGIEDPLIDIDGMAVYWQRTSEPDRL